MRLLKRLAASAVMIGLLVGCMPLGVLAATVKSISSVSLSVGLEEQSSGETLPSESGFSLDSATGNYVYSTSDRYYVQSVEWITSDEKEMSIGYEPKMRVTLEATHPDDYAFKGGYQSSNVTVKGGVYVSASRSGSSTLYITFKFKPIKGTYDPPEEAYWKESGYGGAKWSTVDYSSDAFDVYLYRGSTIVKKVEGIKATAYNFFPYMTKAGSYSFKVRTVPYSESEKKYGKNSEWTESDEVYVPQEKVSDGSGQDSGNGNPGSTEQVGWVKDNDTWFYRYPDGSYQKDSWTKLNNKWYLFANNGAMLRGWQQKNNLWYFLDDSGAMATGWILSNNKWYFTNPSTTSGVEGAMMTGWIAHNNKWYYTDTSGAMVEGWRQIDSSWYYLYPGEGSKAVNTTISGFPVDGNGIWHK